MIQLWERLKQFLPPKAIEKVEARLPAVTQIVEGNRRRNPTPTVPFRTDNQLGFKPPRLGNRNEKGT